jgi:AcrR family transcriptional regulator
VAVAKRRTQEERRTSTISRLLSATISCLAHEGYAKTTTAGVCKKAELSQGALFRHFGSRADLIAAATTEICERHIALVGESAMQVAGASGKDAARGLVTAIRDAARTPEHAAWHEVMVAARCDEHLRALVSPTLKAFETDLLKALGTLGGAAPGERIGTILLSLLHVFDSEAVTVAVYGNPALEADRVDWLSELLARELAQSRP